MAYAIHVFQNPDSTHYTARFSHDGGKYTPAGSWLKNAHDVRPHKDCVGNGMTFWTMESYSNDSWCTGCEYHNYSPIGD